MKDSLLKIDDRVALEVCLLDATNQRVVKGKTIAERILSGGKACLWNERPAGQKIDTVVIHYISAIESNSKSPFDLESILWIFCELRVSSHFLVQRNGDIMQLVPPLFRAWHAGASLMPPPDSRTNVNDFSIGIELVATHDSGFTTAQYRALTDVITAFEKNNGFLATLVGHEHISGEQAVLQGVRDTGKVDPGPRFDWALLYRLLGRPNS